MGMTLAIGRGSEGPVFLSLMIFALIFGRKLNGSVE
jgi:hypothetical protein